MPHYTTILFFYWLLAIIMAIWALRLAQFFGKRLGRGRSRPLEEIPDLRVAVILPVKGVDGDTRANVQALLNQNYPHYRLLFAVESASDPAVALLEELSADAPPGRVDIIIAGCACERGQKIHNQLAAVERTDARDDILAFMDADAHPDPDWLRALVTPLTYGPHIGATTGYRFYVPATSHPANAIVSVINAGVASLFGPYRRTFAWGGSMALRRADFFAYGIHDAWQNALSDDYVLSHCVRLAHKKIHFVPRCLVASSADFTWASFFEFAIRQYRITRICAPLVWAAAVTGPLLYLGALLYTLIFSVVALVQPVVDAPLEPLRLGIMFVSLYAISAVRGWCLLQTVREPLAPEWPALGRLWCWYTLGYPLVQAVNLAALLGSAVGRTIVWRQVTYTMLSRTRTVVRHAATPHPAPARQELEEARR